MTVPIINRLNAVGGRLLGLGNGLRRPASAGLEASRWLRDLIQDPVEQLSARLGHTLERIGTPAPAEAPAPIEESAPLGAAPFAPRPFAPSRAVTAPAGARRAGSAAKKSPAVGVEPPANRAASAPVPSSGPERSTAVTAPALGLASPAAGFEAPAQVLRLARTETRPVARLASVPFAPGAIPSVSAPLPPAPQGRAGVPAVAAPSRAIQGTPAVPVARAEQGAAALPIARADTVTVSAPAAPSAIVDSPSSGARAPSPAAGGIRLTPGIGRLSSLLQANLAQPSTSLAPPPVPAAIAVTEPVQPVRLPEAIEPVPSLELPAPAAARAELASAGPREAHRAPVELGVIETERLADALADHLELELLRVYGTSGR